MTIYEALFGSPEAAARTINKLDPTTLDFCCMLDALSDDNEAKCRYCPYDYDRYGCEPKDMTYLEWLNQEVVE